MIIFCLRDFGLPNKGIWSDVTGIASLILCWKTVNERRTVTPERAKCICGYWMFRLKWLVSIREHDDADWCKISLFWHLKTGFSLLYDRPKRNLLGNWNNAFYQALCLCFCQQQRLRFCHFSLSNDLSFFHHFLNQKWIIS